jgi:hypothetical protein
VSCTSPNRPKNLCFVQISSFRDCVCTQLACSSYSATMFLDACHMLIITTGTFSDSSTAFCGGQKMGRAVVLTDLQARWVGREGAMMVQAPLVPLVVSLVASLVVSLAVSVVVSVVVSAVQKGSSRLGS